ncbi:MAG: YigZ family protein [Atopostipes suicloacalis]|nr:YigZ family protein [Atopostipes suicloacalis]
MENYRTIKKNGLYEIEIKKSKFICFLKRVDDEEEALEFIEEIKKEHWKATHNCSAYTIGVNDEIQRAHDDGEPSGTAGVPMLEILLKKELKNVVAVVTRYFGGIKLGAGGLIRAYGGAVNQAVEHVGIVERQLQQLIDLSVSYSQSGQVEHSLREAAYTIQDISYAEKITYHCVIPIDMEEKFKEDIANWTSGEGEIKGTNKAWIEVPVEK